MINDFFYSREDKKKYQISDKVLDRIKKLKSEVQESDYYSYQVRWNDGDEDDWITMQFLSMLGRPNDRVIEKYDLKNPKKGYLMTLLRSVYLDPLDECVAMGYKRPFGNSGVLYDVHENLIQCNLIKDDADDDDYDPEYDGDSLESKCLKEFSEFIIDFYSDGFILDWTNFEYNVYVPLNTHWDDIKLEYKHYFLEHWSRSKSEMREKKLSEILN